MELIPRSQWSAHDPAQGMAAGKSAEEGFSHSLVFLSQIAFTSDGKDALVGFGMVCGDLCGSGATLRLHQSGAGWSVVSRCRNWIS